MTVVDQFWVESTQHSWNAAHNSPKVGTAILRRGRKYRVTVDGNMTVWISGAGHSGYRIKYPSPGRDTSERPSSDGAYSLYGESGQLNPPVLGGAVTFSTDDRATRGRLDYDGPVPTSVNPQHVYSFVAVGEGYPLWAAISDTPISDNNGRFLITVEALTTGWTVGALGVGGSVRVDPRVLVPYGSDGWKYQQPVEFASGSNPYAHDPAFAQPSFDDAGWDVGKAPFGGSDTYLPIPGRTYWRIQSGIRLRRKVWVNTPSDLVAEVNVDNLAYIYWNGEMLHFFDNSGRTSQKSAVTIPQSKVSKGWNTFAVMGWEETYHYTPEGGYIDVELRKP